MGIITWILDQFGGYVMGNILNKQVEDKPKDMKDAFNTAYNAWFVSHRDTIIKKSDYDELKPRFIDTICNRHFKYENEEEKTLFDDWHKQIDKGSDTNVNIQRELTGKVVNEVEQFKLRQVQVDQGYIPFKYFDKNIKLYIAASAIMAIFVVATECFLGRPITQLLVPTCIGILIYSAILYCKKDEILFAILKYLKNLRF